MANLYSGKVESNGEYINLIEETGITLEEDHVYQIQFLNQGFIREGEDGSGFFMTSNKPFSMIYKGDPIFVCSAKSIGINIAELAKSSGGGSTPVIESLSITPTTSAQTITAPSGTDGYSPISVSAVTASIDSNIQAGNIKDGVTILSVNGSLVELEGETRTETLTSSSGNTFTPSSGKNGITSITVTPNNEARTVTPTTSQQSLNVNSGYSGNGTITVNAVTSAIDQNISAGNIKKDVTILGVTGSYEGSGGGGSTEYTDPDGYLVVVVDYDGTVLKEDKLNSGKTFTLPNVPTHTGLTFQEWSSTETITNNTVTVSDDNILIGAIYKTTSGVSEFDIVLTKVTGLTVIFAMRGNKNWGDGTTDSATSHTYSAYGKYTITCDGSTVPSNLFGQNNNTMQSLVGARLSDSVTEIQNYAFEYLTSMKYLTVPNSVTTIGYNITSYCYALITLILPDSITSSTASDYCSSCWCIRYAKIPNSAVYAGKFSECYAMLLAVIPKNATTLKTSNFNNCYSYTSRIRIPNTITTIPSNAFSKCATIREYDFTSFQSIPTLSNTNAFSNMNYLCKIKVPSSLETSWKGETNWATYADYIVGV